MYKKIYSMVSHCFLSGLFLFLIMGMEKISAEELTPDQQWRRVQSLKKRWMPDFESRPQTLREAEERWGRIWLPQCIHSADQLLSEGRSVTDVNDARLNCINVNRGIIKLMEIELRWRLRSSSQREHDINIPAEELTPDQQWRRVQSLKKRWMPDFESRPQTLREAEERWGRIWLPQCIHSADQLLSEGRSVTDVNDARLNCINVNRGIIKLMEIELRERLRSSSQREADINTPIERPTHTPSFPEIPPYSQQGSIEEPLPIEKPTYISIPKPEGEPTPKPELKPSTPEWTVPPVGETPNQRALIRWRTGVCLPAAQGNPERIKECWDTYYRVLKERNL